MTGTDAAGDGTSSAQETGPSALSRSGDGSDTVSMDTAGKGPQALSRGECLDLLRTPGLGRIAYSQRALPAIVTVGYAVLDESVVLRLDAEAPELPSLRNAVVAFQTDKTDQETRTGWSVTCVGRARPVTDPDDLRLLAATTRAAAGETSPAFLRLEPEIVDGRLFHELPMSGSRHLNGVVAPAS